MDNNTKDKSELEKTIENFKKERNINEQEKEIRINLKDKPLSKIERANEILDEELIKINKKIKESNPKWIINDFNEFIYYEYDKFYKREVLVVKIINKKDAIELANILKDISKNNFKCAKITWKYDIKHYPIGNNLNLDKVLDLIKAFVFYSNTKIERDKLKFTTENKSKTSILTYSISTIIYLAMASFVLFIIFCIFIL